MSVSMNLPTIVTAPRRLLILWAKTQSTRLKRYTVVRKIVEVDGQASTNCPAAVKSYEYDANGFVSKTTDWLGNVTEYEHDNRGLMTSMTQAVGDAAERTINVTYDSTFRLPNVITETGKTTDYDYDSDGRVTKVTVTDTGTSETRITTYSYHSNTTDANGNTVLR